MKTKLIISFVLLLITAESHLTNSQWQQTAMTTGNVTSLAGNTGHIFAAKSSLYLSTDNGLSWVYSGVSANQVCVNGTFTFITASAFPNVSRSTNYGANWTTANVSAADGVTSVAGSGNNVFVGTVHYGTRRSTNNGDSWAVLLPGVSGTVHVHAADGNTIFASNTVGLYRSTDGGDNWSPTTLPVQTINSIIINGTRIYAASNFNGVYISADNGTTWILSSLDNQSVKSLAVSVNNVFAGTNDAGVYVSTNSGTSWVPKNEGLTNLRVDALLINGNYIYAGTYGAGVWKRNLSELVAVNIISAEVPKEYNLFQNYPNPFNPTTNFEFRIADFGFVCLTIYDISGKEVEVLVNETLKPGIYKASWDASNKPSGIYFYKIIAGEYSETKKMILINSQVET